jgi:dipeptide/tripeptide permease
MLPVVFFGWVNSVCIMISSIIIKVVMDKMHGRTCISKRDKFDFILINLCMQFFVPTIRIRNNYSNVDGIEDYSNSRLFVDIPNDK